MPDERDPRTDPRPGDVLDLDLGIHQATARAIWTDDISVSIEMRGDCRGHVSVPVEIWRRLAVDARIIARGENACHV